MLWQDPCWLNCFRTLFPIVIITFCCLCAASCETVYRDHCVLFFFFFFFLFWGGGGGLGLNFCFCPAVAQGVEPASCYWKVTGSIPLVCMSKCPWAKY